MSSAGDGFLFTSESVTEGHPDKVADQISDAIVDAALTEDAGSRVAVETLLTTGLVVLAGEITTNAVLDFAAIARQVICEIGYDTGDFGFDGNAVGVITALDRQSPDIARGVTESHDARNLGSTDPFDSAGAGDQGMMFGYATNETPEFMPMPIVLAHKLARRLAQVRRNGLLPYLRPDGKTQVTVRYDADGKPAGVEKVLISTQHEDGVEVKLPDALWEQVVTQALPPELYDAGALRKEFYVNPTGRFVIGGPVGDTGLTGRKIIVDTYGGFARHGGGAFSGKDPSKVDRSASYAARHVAKNIVAAGLADRAEVQVAYAIGVARPLSLLIETFGTEKIARPVIAIRPGPRPLRPAARRPGGGAEPAASDLPPDRGLRALRPRRGRVHLGEHGQGRRPPRRGRPRLGPRPPRPGTARPTSAAPRYSPPNGPGTSPESADPPRDDGPEARAGVFDSVEDLRRVRGQAQFGVKGLRGGVAGIGRPLDAAASQRAGRSRESAGETVITDRNCTKPDVLIWQDDVPAVLRPSVTCPARPAAGDAEQQPTW